MEDQKDKAILCEHCHKATRWLNYDCCKECEEIYQLMEFHGIKN